MCHETTDRSEQGKEKRVTAERSMMAEAAKQNGRTCRSNWRTKLSNSGIGLLLLIFFAPGAAWAVSGVGDPPIYNPASKSYFQMQQLTGRDHRWREALEQARAQVFKGAQGRLAVVDSQETHEFIMRNFDVSKEIWIGLRYWCDFRMLEWVGLRPYSPSDPGHFQAWHPQWSRHDQGCIPRASGVEGALGVYYQPAGNQNARWQAVRWGKGFGRLLVEYPTGGE